MKVVDEKNSLLQFNHSLSELMTTKMNEFINFLN